MGSINVIVTFCIVLVKAKLRTGESYPANSSDNIYPIVASVTSDLPMCRNFPICPFVERFHDEEHKQRDSQNYRSAAQTSLQARSYYGGYGGSPLAPALYPAIDTVSVLASLAFLAFLLHSFASLFDRSRSIIPSIVSNRGVSDERDIPNPVKLVLQALDEYDILSDNMVLGDPKSGGKTSLHRA